MYMLFNGDNKEAYGYYKDNIEEYILTTNYKYAKKVKTFDEKGSPLTYEKEIINNLKYNEEEYLLYKKELEKENLIQEKIREQAIEKLINEGKLDKDGNLIS